MTTRCGLRAGPLQGMKVLDFTTLLPGPYSSMMLADMGAEVLRIESPIRPDMARITPPLIAQDVSATHAMINRNKRALGLNLKTKEAKNIIYELVRPKEGGFDVILEGFRPGVMEKLGLGYNDLKKINGDVIYCSITGYGQTGPMRDRAGHDINYLALSGLASYGGTKGNPSLSAMQIADIAGGSHHAVIGILAACQQRANQRLFGSKEGVEGEEKRRVLGQHIDISMADCTFGKRIEH